MPDEPYKSLRFAQEAVLVVGEDGVVVFANQAARAVLRRSDAQLVGLPFIDPALGLRTLADEPLTEEVSPVGQVIRSGMSISPTEYIERHPDGSVAILSLAARPLTLGQGAPGVSVQIAEAARLFPDPATPPVALPLEHWEASARRLQGLAQMSGLLASTLNTDEAFAQVAEYACVLFDVPACAVLREDREKDVFVPAAVSGLDESLMDCYLRGEDARTLGLDRPVPLIVSELNALAHLDFFRRFQALQYDSAVCLGLVTEVRPHGVIVLLKREPFALAEEDLVFLRLFGTMAAATLNTAERHETDSLVAETVQNALLAIPEQLPGLEHAALYRSASKGAVVGGDFYDLFSLPDGRLAILIGDISGKGLDASLLMAVLKNTVKAYAYTSTSPAEIMRLCNTLLLDSAPPLSFATAFLALYDADVGRLQYCGAGHPPPFLVRADGSVQPLEPRSPVLGMLADANYVDDLADFSAGEILFLYTDGVTETRSEEGFLGEELLLQLLLTQLGAPAQQVVEGVFAAVDEFAGGQFSDDLAMLVVRANRLGG